MEPAWVPDAFFYNIGIAWHRFTGYIADKSWEASAIPLKGQWNAFDFENHTLWAIWSSLWGLAAWSAGQQLLPHFGIGSSTAVNNLTQVTRLCLHAFMHRCAYAAANCSECLE